MPKFLEDKLKAEYRAKGKRGRALDNAVYGTMNAIGAMHGNKETAKGRSMEAKHERDIGKLKGEAHEYDSRREKKPVRSRYAK